MPYFANKNVLLVEDDDSLRFMLEDVLSERGFSVVSADNGNLGLEMYLKGGIDVIVSDVVLNYLSGIEFLQKVKGIRDTPFILMTGGDEPSQKGDGFLRKPFAPQDLVQVIASTLNLKVDVEKNGDDSEFCRMSILDVPKMGGIPFDLFIRLREGKYVKITHKGEELSEERQNRLIEKNVKMLFVKKLQVCKACLIDELEKKASIGAVEVD
jgi:CheY-like chemotaxis protein